ncbi:hypothetical protein CERSUDRAFT_110431 [Gelatoporia subvermispora B]|uniref:Uncharacterized protein n=1 Tax=Ceriporiopsis subvermispora (strain B) TaxID=914234 RepID=M2RTU4_CERS8|nr:hypothetical protein CERSUDRAFT_110431 [Gelatoporia subvermispora B]
MAKPKPHATPATHSVPQPRPSRPRHPRKINLSRRLPTCQATPSSSVLAILGTVAAATCTVDGHPLPTQTPPPDFLCPGLDLRPTPTPTPPPLPRATVLPEQIDVDPSRVAPLLRQALLAERGNVFLAPKYVQGNDGLWRKTDHYSLYGSLVCVDPPCSNMAVPTSPIVLGDSSSSSSTIPASPAVYPLPTPEVDEGSLPPGWEKDSDDRDLLTPIITVLSLVLAMAICLFISGCVAWRRKRRAQKVKDPEKHKRKDVLYDSDTEQEDADDAQRVRRQKRLWAKTSARWRAGVRLSARRRRKRPAAAAKDGDDRPQSEVSSIRPSTSSASLEASMLVSRPDAASPHPSTPCTPVPRSPASSAPQSRSPSPCPDPAHSLPPAYLFSTSSSPHETPVTGGRSQSSEPDLLCTSTDRAETPLPPHEPRRSRSSSLLGASRSSINGMHAAHVAIDDKAVLARMAEYASIPPPESDLTSGVAGGSSTAYASVPPPEDEFEEIPFSVGGSLDPECGEGPANLCHSLPPASQSTLMLASTDGDGLAHAPSYEAGPSGLCPLIPPPLTKTRLPPSMFFDYPASDLEDDIINIEPVFGPSAPPFEEEPVPDASAPPLVYDYAPDAAVLPSAPTLVADEGDFIEPGTDPYHRDRSVPPLPRPPPASADTQRSVSPSGEDSDQSRTPGTNPPCYPA